MWGLVIPSTNQHPHPSPLSDAPSLHPTPTPDTISKPASLLPPSTAAVAGKSPLTLTSVEEKVLLQHRAWSRLQQSSAAAAEQSAFSSPLVSWFTPALSSSTGSFVLHCLLSMGPLARWNDDGEEDKALRAMPAAEQHGQAVGSWLAARLLEQSGLLSARSVLSSVVMELFRLYPPLRQLGTAQHWLQAVLSSLLLVLLQVRYEGEDEETLLQHLQEREAELEGVLGQFVLIAAAIQGEHLVVKETENSMGEAASATTTTTTTTSAEDGTSWQYFLSHCVVGVLNSFVTTSINVSANHDDEGSATQQQLLLQPQDEATDEQRELLLMWCIAMQRHPAYTSPLRQQREATAVGGTEDEGSQKRGKRLREEEGAAMALQRRRLTIHWERTVKYSLQCQSSSSPLPPHLLILHQMVLESL